ncbi:hypothetical protein VB1_CDS0053 [Arthrobacter phage Marchesin]|nr:hypothetical protein VB1_CDS0053 [Arthrobacter phage Marchesin]
MAENEGVRGPFQSGPFEITDDDVAVVVFDKPDTIGDLGISLGASVRAREGLPPVVLVAALRQLADDLERQFLTEGQCPCGLDHG